MSKGTMYPLMWLVKGGVPDQSNVSVKQPLSIHLFVQRRSSLWDAGVSSAESFSSRPPPPPPHYCSCSMDRRVENLVGGALALYTSFWSLSTHICEMESFSLLTREDRFKMRNESETHSGALKKCDTGHVVAILSQRKVFSHTQNSVCKLSG